MSDTPLLDMFLSEDTPAGRILKNARQQARREAVDHLAQPAFEAAKSRIDQTLENVRRMRSGRP